MGVIADALAIVVGGLFGGKLQKKKRSNDYALLAICILMLSLVGFLENVYNVEGQRSSS